MTEFEVKPRDLGAPLLYVRERAVKRLQKYLKIEHNDLEYLKLWKGMFYALWLSDKWEIQLELAERLAKLVHQLPNYEATLKYWTAFVKTMVREWNLLDKYRVNKFYALIRKSILQFLLLIKNEGYGEKEISLFHEKNLEHAFGSRTNGVALHIIDIFLEEMREAKPTSETINPLLNIFLILLKTSTNKRILKKLESGIFRNIIENEYSYIFGITKEKIKLFVNEKEELKKLMIYLEKQIFEITSTKETRSINKKYSHSLSNLYRNKLLKQYPDYAMFVLSTFDTINDPDTSDSEYNSEDYLNSLSSEESEDYTGEESEDFENSEDFEDSEEEPKIQKKQIEKKKTKTQNKSKKKQQAKKLPKTNNKIANKKRSRTFKEKNSKRRRNNTKKKSFNIFTEETDSD
ncbi:RIBOSOMAL RNA-PROCESSING [Anaeramoeba flamelloides]|uniref:RIBOSOMAL RNA-PROCESSING n=1 Tax=Anaeramoeba flamelloides TaxID=1746091 RepID=A0AAV7YZ10_9EUKA|nr:RIBOSOMAL RNA-PROCESSING [Anaeramoeba flamelloides]